MTIDKFVELAMSFPGTIEKPHFDLRAFKVDGKRIFTTLHENTKTANVRLSPDEQKVFCSLSESIIFPIPNKCGEQGWTTLDLLKLDQEIVLEALNSAYQLAFKK